MQAEEVLARFVAGLSPSMQQDLFNALQAYHEQYYRELVNAPQAIIQVSQGKVQAMEKVTDVVMRAREIVATVERRMNPPPKQPHIINGVA
jgi:hypothetical protein